MKVKVILQGNVYIASVRPSKNFNIGHNFFNIEDSNFIFGMDVYLMQLHILSGGRSKVKYTASVRLSENFNIAHNFCNIEDSNLIFGMHVYLMELHILSCELVS